MTGEDNIPLYNENSKAPDSKKNIELPEIYMVTNMQAIIEKISYLTALEKANGALIKQKVDFEEIITGADTNNIYNVFLKNPDGTFVYLFKAKEDSEICSKSIFK